MEAIAFPTSAPITPEVVGAAGGIGRGTGRRTGGTLDGVRRVHPVPGVSSLIGSPTRLHQLFEARFALERAAVWRPRERGLRHDPAVVAELAARWSHLADGDDRALARDFTEADDDFHVRLASAAADPGLTLALADLHARIRAVRPAAPPSPARMRRAVGEHLRVLGAIGDDDLELASRLLDRHLVRSMTAAEQQVACELAREIARRRVS